MYLTANGAHSMHLLSAEIGWGTFADVLLLTQDNGRHQSDTTTQC